MSPLASADDRIFLREILRCEYATDHGSRRNDAAPSATEGPFRGMNAIHVSAGAGEDGVYGVEMPGGLEGLSGCLPACLRYADGGVGAAVAAEHKGVRRIVCGFPFECITGFDQRRETMRRILEYLAP